MTPDFRDRMRGALGQRPTEGHPTADDLNAYAEQALTPTEAQRVLQHLSVCAECRDIVYLASAAREEPAQAPHSERAKRKVRWWAWAVPVAATAVIASTILLVNSERAPNRQMAANVPQTAKQESAPTVAAPPAANETKAEGAVPASNAEKPRRTPAVTALKVAPSTRAAEKDKTTKAAAEGSPAFDTLTRLEAKNAPTTPQPVPMRRRDALADSGSAPAPPVSNADAVNAITSVNVTGQSEQVQVPQTNAVNAGTLNRRVASPAAYSTAEAVSKKALAPRTWRVTSSGGLEHFVGIEWKRLATAPSKPLLAVSNVGADVWAGATNRELYHSGDEGKHWERQHLPQEVHGEIAQLAFTSTLDGTVQTSTGELWATHDGGITWARTNPAP